MLGFINRSSSDFNNPKALKSLYCSFIRSILEYYSIVWSPYTLGPINFIEGIQHWFLRILVFKCGIQRQRQTSYLPLLTITNLET